nr:uncharacterized protein LOC129261537 [Lytechinus pictus]
MGDAQSRLCLVVFHHKGDGGPWSITGYFKDITRHSATPSGGTRPLASSKKQPTPSTLPSSSPSILRGDREKDTTFSSTSSQNRIKNVSFQSQKKFEEEPGGQSLQRAMKHLSRLKTLVAVETASPMASSRGGVSSL